MTVLTDEQKAFVVQRLACFDSPQTVADAFKEEFGEVIARAKVYNYDPTRPSFDQAEKWRELFDATRKAFLADTAEIGIAHKSVRLRRLDDLCQRALSQRNYGLAASLMEQAAKEAGDAFTNKRALVGGSSDDPPIRTSVTVEFV